MVDWFEWSTIRTSKYVLIAAGAIVLFKFLSWTALITAGSTSSREKGRDSMIDLGPEDVT